LTATTSSSTTSEGTQAEYEIEGGGGGEGGEAIESAPALDRKTIRNDVENLKGKAWTITMDSSAVRQYFELSPADGVIVNRLSNDRVFVLGASIWGAMEEELSLGLFYPRAAIS
jgi:hypothetical protein